MKSIIFTFYIIFITLTISEALNRWPNHDISTLKALQIVHRHGDRAPIMFSPKDPYKEDKYWKEGIGQLTTKGKYRLYKTGEYIRHEYNDYLGDKYSPREVYARSSAEDRCIESVSCLLSGAYPPKQHDWQWNNGTDAQLGEKWQPIPIESFMPKSDDLVLEEQKFCLSVYNQMAKILNRTVVKEFLKQNSDFYNNLTMVVGERVSSLLSAQTIHETLQIEMDHNYYWIQNWTKEEEKRIVSQLYESHLMFYRYEWDSPIIKRLRAGGLVKELNKNFQKVLNNENAKKLYVYSTHDTVMAALMQALNIFNDRMPPFGATLLFELHQKNNSIEKNGYFVRVFYKNETDINTENPHSIHWTDCDNQLDCPLNQYFNSTKHLLYTDFSKECNEKHSNHSYY